MVCAVTIFILIFTIIIIVVVAITITLIVISIMIIVGPALESTTPTGRNPERLSLTSQSLRKAKASSWQSCRMQRWTHLR